MADRIKPRVIGTALEIEPASERYCTCCKKTLKGAIAWLELDQRTRLAIVYVPVLTFGASVSEVRPSHDDPMPPELFCWTVTGVGPQVSEY